MNNPLDGTGAMYDDDKIFPRLLQGLIDDANIDIVTINLEANDPQAERTEERQPLSRWRSKKPRRPAKSPSQLSVPSSAVRSIRRFFSRCATPASRSWKAPSAPRRRSEIWPTTTIFRNRARPAAAKFPWPTAHAKLPSGILGAEAAFALFKEFDIPVAPTVLTRSADEAAAAADKMGYPVVLKVESAQITHKSDVGGVALQAVQRQRQFATRSRSIQSKSQADVPNAKIDGVVVQRMAGEGVEMILGIKRDPLFGPVVLCGLGGILVEVLKDVAVGIPPLSRRASPRHARTSARFSNSRRRARQTGRRCRCAVRRDRRHLAISPSASAINCNGVDINPLIVLPKGQGVVAVDAVVEIQ